MIAFGCLTILATNTAGQYAADATLVPQGLLRLEFAPHYSNYDFRFSVGSSGLLSGDTELLGTDFTADSAGPNLFPALGPSEDAVAAITGDGAYRLNLGAFNTIRDADIRNFAFSLSVGLLDRVTISARLPIVTHRMQVAFTFDSTEANVGWNQAVAALGSVETANMAAALLAQLTTAILELEGLIAGGSFGCPSDPSCAAAQDALARATVLRDQVGVLTGLESTGGGLASVAPLQASTAGQAILAEVAAVAAELQGLGTSGVTATLPLPTDPLSTSDINRLLTDEELGYAGQPLAFIRGTSLGDTELSLRFGLIQSPNLRTVITGTVRLPTSKLDGADNFLDLGTGDAQMDIVGGIEIAWQPGAAGIALGGRYTLQLQDNPVRRIGPPSSPLLPVSTRTIVTRDLGDIIHLFAYPTLRLSSTFTAYASATYFRKQADQYSNPVDPSAATLFPISSLGEESAMEALSIGAGLSYRTTSEFAPGGRMPIEAGVSYQSAFNGKGGLTPKTNEVRLFLRLFYNLFAGDGDEGPAGSEQQ